MAISGDEVTEQDNSAYQARYGSWAGFERGHAPDYGRCCVSVHPPGRATIPQQCRKKRGYGPGLAYCKQHDPEAAKARQDKASEAYRAKVEKWRYEFFGRTFYEALEQIANGHNDARGLAQEVIAKFKGK